MRKGGKSEALNNMINRKRIQALNLKKTRNRQCITNILMTSLLIGGTLIPTYKFMDLARLLIFHLNVSNTKKFNLFAP